MYSEEILKEIESFAYKYLLRAEIAMITGINEDELKDPQSPAYKAFWKGRYIRKAEFNASLIALSKQLSSPAMAIEHKIAESVHINDLKIR